MLCLLNLRGSFDVYGQSPYLDPQKPGRPPNLLHQFEMLTILLHTIQNGHILSKSYRNQFFFTWKIFLQVLFAKVVKSIRVKKVNLDNLDKSYTFDITNCYVTMYSNIIIQFLFILAIAIIGVYLLIQLIKLCITKQSFLQ